MKKKIFLFLFIIITSLSLLENVKAEKGNCGAVRYDVTNLNIRDEKITFTGWAFINCTQNYTDYKGNDSSIVKSGGGQKIKIRAIDSNGNQVGSEKEVNGSIVNNINYNFYCQQYYFQNEKSECEKAYNGTFPSSGWNNRCTDGVAASQCLYQNVGFSITFNTSEWNVEDGTQIRFQIAVTNRDYQNKYNRSYSNWETLSLNKAIKPDIKNNPNIEIVKNSSGESVKVIISEGIFRDINGNYVVETSDGTKGSCTYVRKDYAHCKPYSWSDAVEGEVYKISSSTIGAFKNGYSASTINEFKILGNTTTYSPGRYIVYVEKGWRGERKRYPGSDKEMVLYASWVKPTGEFVIKVYNDKKCKPSQPNIKASCNSSSSSFSSTCEELTVKTNDANDEIKSKANIKISQTGSITTILTPTNTYAGGGFKFGIMYHNTISWSLVKQYKGTIEDITKEMQAKLKENFVDGFGLKNVKFGNEQIPDDYFKQNIKCQETGSFTNGNTLTTMCIVYLPNSVVEEYTGKVTYKQGDNLGLNNKYYTPIDWNSNKKYEIVATISGMDRLKESSVKADSKDKNKVWTGTWEYTLNGSKDNCDINLYPLYGQPTGGKKNLKYIFIYRPIDLNNPFPNRNPGMNWYDWYNIERNKERLESSYNREQYSITLDSQKTSEIKKYNKDELNKGGYFDWKTIENGQSSFVDKYFDKKRDNIVGDNS
ncbi:MAG: hypothetical protein UCL21_04495 [Bacilli bacterium]|nr:hypothetical protein [Bacilli bacterium]